MRFIFFSLVAFVLSFGVILAQEESLIGVSVSPIEIKNIQTNVDAQTNTISGSFIIKNNSESFIPDLGWRVYLKEKDKLENGVLVTQQMLDYTVSNEFSTFVKDAERKINFSLPYSPFILSGQYDLVIEILNKVGNFYASVVSQVDINALGGLINFESLKCQVRRGDGIVFFINAGGNFDPNSSLILTCEVISPFKTSKTLKVKHTYAEQSLLDYLNANLNEEYLSPITLKSGTNKIEFNIKTQEKPQSYHNVIRLYNDDNQPVSNMLFFRYVVRGESAVITTLSLDKDFYPKGGKAEVNFSYFGPADLFWNISAPGIIGDESQVEAGTTLEGASTKITISDSRGNICGESLYSMPRIESAFTEHKAKVDISINKNCSNPQAKMAILSKDQKQLSEYKIAVPSAKEVKAKALTFKTVLYIIIALIAVMAAIFFARSRKKTFLIMIFGFLVLFQLAPLNNVLAEGDGWNFIKVRRMPSGPHEMYYELSNVTLNGPSSISINNNQPANYNFTTGFSLTRTSCNNDQHFPMPFYIRLSYYIADANGNIVYQPDPGYLAVWKSDEYLEPWGSLYQSKSFTLNLPPLNLSGNYQLVFDYRLATPLALSTFPNYYFVVPIRDNDRSIDQPIISNGMLNGLVYTWIQYFPSEEWPLEYPVDFSQDSVAYTKSFINAYCIKGDKSTCPRVLAGEGGCDANGCTSQEMLYLLALKRVVSLTAIGPPTLSFSASPTSIIQGQPSTLSWSSQNTTSCAASGAWSGPIWPLQNGSLPVGPTQTSTYTLTCSGPGGSVSQSAAITVIAPQLTASCSVSLTSIIAGESVTWTTMASGGIGSYSYSWSGSDGLSGNSNPIAKTYNSPGSKNASVSVTSGSQTVSQSCSSSVSVSPQSLSASLSASPSSGTAPLNGVDLTAVVSGTSQGTINYTFYCNRLDDGTGITSGWAAKYDGVIETTKTAVDVCDYPSQGTYTAKVIVERGSAPAAESRTNVSVSVVVPPPPPPPPPPCDNDGTCEAGETCSNCSGDCGICPPPPPPCGNGICEADESYLTCPIDCKPQCSDGIDNDGDSKIDYPQDTGCSSSSDNDERKALFQEF